jgi:hypothetical protein
VVKRFGPVVDRDRHLAPEEELLLLPDGQWVVVQDYGFGDADAYPISETAAAGWLERNQLELPEELARLTPPRNPPPLRGITVFEDMTEEPFFFDPNSAEQWLDPTMPGGNAHLYRLPNGAWIACWKSGGKLRFNRLSDSEAVDWFLARGYAPPKELETLLEGKDLGGSVPPSPISTGGLPKRRKKNSVCIIFLGNRQYRVGESTPVTVEENEDNVLQAFLKQSTMDEQTLVAKSGVDHARKVLGKLKTKYDAIMKRAIRLPGRRGNGGYYVAIKSL